VKLLVTRELHQCGRLLQGAATLLSPLQLLIFFFERSEDLRRGDPSPCPGQPSDQWHTKDENDVTGCALAIVDKADPHSIVPEDFTIFSVTHHCVWNRFDNSTQFLPTAHILYLGKRPFTFPPRCPLALMASAIVLGSGFIPLSLARNKCT